MKSQTGLAPGAASQRARNATADWLKAIGIVLVLFGHTWMPPLAHKAIYLFHMPLFFFITGLLLSPRVVEGGFLPWVRNRILPLLRFYVFFFVLGSIAFYYSSHRGDLGAVEAVLNRLHALAISNSPAEFHEQDGTGVYPVALWYFPCLIVALLLFFGARQVFKSTALFLTATFGLGALGFLFSQFDMPWHVESAMFATFWIGAGYAVSQHRGILQHLNSVPVLVFFFGLGLIVVSAFAGASFYFRTMLVTRWPLALLCMPLGIVSVYGLCRKLPPHPLIERLSNATILLFPLHMLAFEWMQLHWQKPFLSLFPFKGAYLFFSLLKVVLVLGVLTFLHPFLAKPLSWVAGKSR